MSIGLFGVGPVSRRWWPARLLLRPAWVLLSVLLVGQAMGQAYVIGPSDQLALDQPRITFGLTDETDPDNPQLIGPTLQNLALLDTGANGVLLAGLSYSDGEDYGSPLFPFDYDGNGTIDSDEQTAQYAELGVAGTSLLDVHHPHGFRILDSSGQELVITPDNLIAFGDDDLNIGSFAAIVGMPAMDGYVIEIDLRPLANPFAGDFIGVNYHNALADAPFESAGSFEVVMDILPPEYTDTTLPEALRPTFAGLPLFSNIDLRHTGGADSGGATLDAEDHVFLVDTGAQTNIMSEAIATELGIDFTRTLAEGGDVLDFLEVGGIGGTALMPLVAVDRFTLPSTTGTELVFTDLLIGVLDIDGAPFEAVFGMNNFTSGYLQAAFGGGPGGTLTNGTDKDAFDLFVEAGLIFDDIQDVIDAGFITITREELQDLADLGLISSDLSDLSQVYCDLAILEEAIGGTGPSGIAFDKIVFDFTATDGTALLRLDLNELKQIGDTNGDGVVDLVDIEAINLNFGARGNQAQGDVNGDGVVNTEDLNLVLSHFGQSVPAASVPEPGSAALLALGALGLRRGRR
ncbi:MAG: dockerin type I domain-containing protein [Planctomycetota bacterium]